MPNARSTADLTLFQVVARRMTKLTELNLLSMFGESFVKVRTLHRFLDRLSTK
jgi:hypothetical protein